jgi:hypothetical protein
MKIPTIDPKELPYYDTLSAVRRAVDRIEEETGKFTITGPCVYVSSLVSEFIPELEQKGGIYVPLCTGHAFNYDAERKLHIDLSMGQFDSILKSQWKNEKIIDERRKRKKKSLTREELSEYEHAVIQNRESMCYLMGNFMLDDSDRPKKLLKYQNPGDIPYKGIQKMVVLPEDNELLKEYPIITYRLMKNKPDITDFVKKVEAELLRKAA